MTKNGLTKRELDLKEKELKEKERSNRENERLTDERTKSERKHWSSQDVDKATNTFLKGLQGAAGLFENDFSFYNFYSDMIMSQLKQAIECLAGQTEDIHQLVETNEYRDGAATTGGRMGKQNISYYEFQITTGGGAGGNSAMSISSKTFNTDTRGDNSGSTNYDSIDLFKYPLMIDSPTYIICWLLRGIALANFKEARNPSTMVYGLLKAHCYGKPQIMQAFLQYRNSLVDVYNDTVASLNTLCIPFNLPYFRRHQWLAGCVFANMRNTVADQFIICNPHSYYTYNEEAGSLEAHEIERTICPAATTTPDSVVGYIRDMLDSIVVPLTNSQSMATMSGDIKRAFGDGITFDSFLNEEYRKLQPVFVTDIKYLQSFKNASIVPLKTGYTQAGHREPNLDIKEGVDENLDPFIYQGSYNDHIWHGIPCEIDAPYMVNTDGDITDNGVQVTIPGNMIDYYDATNISEEDQCYNLSFVAIYEDGFGTRYLESCRSEVLVKYIQYSMEYKDTTIREHITMTSNVFKTDFEQTSAADLITNCIIEDFSRLFELASYDFVHPIYLIIPEKNQRENYLQLIWNRNYNRNMVSRDLIAKIHKSALYSMFAIENKSSGKSKRRGKARRA
jgi:hypothetical protein